MCCISYVCVPVWLTKPGATLVKCLVKLVVVLGDSINGKMETYTDTESHNDMAL